MVKAGRQNTSPNPSGFYLLTLNVHSSSQRYKCAFPNSPHEFIYDRLYLTARTRDQPFKFVLAVQNKLYHWYRCSTTDNILSLDCFTTIESTLAIKLVAQRHGQLHSQRTSHEMHTSRHSFFNPTDSHSIIYALAYEGRTFNAFRELHVAARMSALPDNRPSEVRAKTQ